MKTLDEVIEWIENRSLHSSPPMYLGTGAGSAGELEEMAINRLRGVKLRMIWVETSLQCIRDILREAYRPMREDIPGSDHSESYRAAAAKVCIELAQNALWDEIDDAPPSEAGEGGRG